MLYTRYGHACMLIYIPSIVYTLSLQEFVSTPLKSEVNSEPDRPGVLEMIRSSSRHNILGNLAPILIGIWSASMFIHGSLLIYIACKCALHLAKDRGEKYMPPLLTVCSMMIAYLYSRNITKYLNDFSSDHLSVACS